MPRLNVIILDHDGNDFNFVMWADVPAARQRFYAKTGAVSVWKDATTTDNTNIASGAVAEITASQRVPSGASLAQIESFLQTQWTNYQAAVTNNNPWDRYGSTWDGTTWTVLNNG